MKIHNKTLTGQIPDLSMKCWLKNCDSFSAKEGLAFTSARSRPGPAGVALPGGPGWEVAGQPEGGLAAVPAGQAACSAGSKRKTSSLL